MWESILEIAFAWLLCAAAAERVAEILADAKLFDWWREFLGEWAFPPSPDPELEWVDNRPKAVRFVSKKAYELFTCGWCLSIWACGVAAWFLPGEYFGLEPHDNIVLKIFGLVFVANFIHAVFRLVHRGRVNTSDFELKLKDLPAIEIVHKSDMAQ